MPKRLGLLVVGTLSFACGPGFEGTFSGILTSTGSCSDGSGGSSSDSFTWRIAEDAKLLTITTRGSCDPVSARVASNGVSATFEPRNCPSFSNGTYSYFPQVTGGTVRLSNDDLIVAMQFYIGVTGAASGSCKSTSTGTLVRSLQ